MPVTSNDAEASNLEADERNASFSCNFCEKVFEKSKFLPPLTNISMGLDGPGVFSFI